MSGSLLPETPDEADGGDLVGGMTPHVPGMEVVLRAGSGDTRPRFERVGRNAWLLAALDEGAADLDDAVTAGLAEAPDLPALLLRLDAVARRRGVVGSALLGLLELDRCGAWLTLVCAGQPLPTVVRRAGWVDARAQLGPALGSRPPDPVGVDRVGLGPGDALVVCSPSLAVAVDAAGEHFADEHLPGALLAAATRPGDELAQQVVQAARAHAGAVPTDASVLVVRVPDDAMADPEARLRRAIGDLAAAPGYPVGVPHWSPHDRPRPPRMARTVLPADSTAAGAARRFLTGVLHSWRLSPLVGGDLDLVASELVGNAVRHAEGATAMLVDYDGERVRVAVGDGSRALPRQQAPSRDALGGRGMAIVAALAAAHGTVPTVGGKRVWADVLVPPGV